MSLIAIASGLAAIAPSIAGWLGGDKAEDAADTVVRMAQQVTGSPSPQGAVDTLKADPAKQLEFMKALDANKTSLDKAFLRDVQDARKRNQHSIMPALICVFMTVALTAFAGSLLFFEVPEGNQRLIDTLFGSYLTAWLSSVAYWVGTTRASAAKSKALGEM